MAETYYQYGQAAQRLIAVDPNNPLLANAVRALDWLPTDEDVAALQSARQALSVPSRTRPTWRESEDDVGNDLGADARRQVSFKDRSEVGYGFPGSVRLDYVQDGIATVEVKNYNIALNSSALIRNVAAQVAQRANQLPDQLIQKVIIDIRGQTVDGGKQQDIIENIVKRSNGAIDAGSINFKGEDE